MPEENLELMLSYLQENSGRYSLEALRGQLLAAGHSSEAADRAITEFRAQGPPPEPRAWRLVLLVAAVDLALLGVSILLSFFPLGLSPILLGVLGFSLPVLYFSQLFAGAVLVDSSVRHRRLGRGLLFGGLYFLGILILAAGGFSLVMLVSY